MEPDHKHVTRQWAEHLKEDTYAHARELKGAADLMRWPRVWQNILHHLPDKISHKTGRSAFEAGCGGGKHLVILAAHGWQTAGIDVSEDVLERGKEYVKASEKMLDRKLEVEFFSGDFFEFSSPRQFDIVFHFGVVEHFLDGETRLAFLRKMFAMTLPGGYIISVVPSGYHPLRSKIRSKGLGGYNIPEIDYTPDNMEEEFRKIGAENIQIIPNNLFGYLAVDDGNALSRLFNKLVFYAWQVVPGTLVPRKFALRHAYALIGIAKKPKQGS